MDSILDQIRSLADEADDVGKRNILEQLRQLQTQLETPMDLFMKLYNSVSRWCSGFAHGNFPEHCENVCVLANGIIYAI